MESAADVRLGSASRDRHQFGLIIGGSEVAPLSERFLPTVAPFTGESIAEIAMADARDVRRATAAAADALPDWKRRSPADRGAVLRDLADLILRHRDELAGLDALEAGKPIRPLLEGEIDVCGGVLRYFASLAEGLSGRSHTLPEIQALGRVENEPVGVCGLIVPWNYPLMMASWKVGPALASGCTAILKPSEFSSLSALRLGELALEAGVPPGVLNVLTGVGAEVGAAMASDDDIRKISFTGSPAAGRAILRAASETNLKRVTLELGGKSANIVFEDADLEKALPALAAGVFSNMGQNCTAGARILAHASIYKDVLKFVQAYGAELVVGDPLRTETDLGPLINETQRERVGSYVESARTSGATVWQSDIASRGLLYPPTVVSDVFSGARICQEEIFGPVVCVIPFRDEGEAVALANDVRYDLAAGVWTRDLDRAHRLPRSLNAGTVWINTYNSTHPAMPFGGFMHSGMGRDLGSEALHGYLNPQSVITKVSGLV